MDSPYTPPSQPGDAVPDLVAKRRFWKRMCWGGLAAFLLAPLIGVAGTVAGIGNAVRQLSETGSADPEKLAASISIALLSTLYSFLFCLPGLIVLILSIVRLRACNAEASKEVP